MELRDVLADYPGCTKGVSPQSWDLFGEKLIAALGTELCLALRKTHVSIPEATAFPGVSVSFQSASISDRDLLIRIAGMVGVQGSSTQATVSGVLFLFLDGQRTCARSGDYYALELHLSTGGVEWHHLGWQMDAYGEFEGIQRFAAFDAAVDPGRE